MADVVRWVHNTDQNEVAVLLESGGDEAVSEAARSRWGASDRDKTTVFSAIDACLSIWQRQRLLSLAATEPRFRFDKFLDGGANTLYVCAPLGSQREYRPFFTAFMSLLFRRTYHANRGFAGFTLDLQGPVKALEESRSGVEPLLVVLDDAGNVAPIPHLQAMVGTSASAAIQLVTVFSDVSQMRVLYGEDAAQSIINNHTALLIMPGSHDTATAELVDQLIRDEDVPGLPPGRSARERVRRLPWGSALCVAGNQPPAVVTLRSSLVDPHLLALRGAENVRS
jgi:type IV secretory pathway TraG/TraD family ATPase VirD4